MLLVTPSPDPSRVPTNPASVRTITHFHRSRLVIDFATSLVRTGNSFFRKWLHVNPCKYVMQRFNTCKVVLKALLMQKADPNTKNRQIKS